MSQPLQLLAQIFPNGMLAHPNLFGVVLVLVSSYLLYERLELPGQLVSPMRVKLPGQLISPMRVELHGQLISPMRVELPGQLISPMRVELPGQLIIFPPVVSPCSWWSSEASAPRSAIWFQVKFVTYTVVRSYISENTVQKFNFQIFWYIICLFDCIKRTSLWGFK